MIRLLGLVVCWRLFRGWAPSCDYFLRSEPTMARWPRHVWTTLFTYSIIFIGFPLLCWLAYRWVRGE